MNSFARITALSCIVALMAHVHSYAGIAPPLHALSPPCLPAGATEIRIGGGYSLNEWNAFESVGTGRELFRIPDLTATFGVSDNVELMFNYAWLLLREDGEELKNGTGDIKITGIYNILRESDLRPNCALLIATKLPDAHYGNRFGTDQTDFWIGGVFSKTSGPLTLLADAVLGILDQPGVSLPDQDDVLAYDIGIMYSVGDVLVVGCGLDGVGLSRFDNDRVFVHGGMAIKTDIGTLDLGLGTGLNEAAGDLRLTAGFTTAINF
ncbi:MAG: hypothetical protein WCL44_06030 [bacterium]